MEKLSSLRNMIVHRHRDIDDRVIYDNAKKGGIEAVKKFIKEIREYVTKNK
ncbi:MAG: hypothetical protein B6U94_07485 [Thermofilum sp. ex4484_79]|nr:MAG: hypothetical protein B6U94_07485 [Thermofilum sp. ex4484_79]